MYTLGIPNNYINDPVNIYLGINKPIKYAQFRRFVKQ